MTELLLQMKSLMQARSINEKRDSHGLTITDQYTRYLLTAKGKQRYFYMGRADGHHLHEVIKPGISDNGTNWYHEPRDNAKENRQHHPCSIFAQFVYLNR